MAVADPTVYRVAILGERVYVRVDGLGSMKNAQTLRSFGDKMVQEGFQSFLLDLEGCTGMDSTFMGTIMGLALATAGGAAPGVVILNAAPSLISSLDTLGVSKFVRINPDIELPQDLDLRDLGRHDLPPRERMIMIQQMHRHLLECQEANRERFGRFLEALERDLET